MGNQIGIGFIGAGGNTRLQHLPGFAAIDGVELVSVANRSRESSEAVAREFGVKSIAADWKAVIEDPEVDAICIGTWPYMHAEITIAALEAGKHVLTEARMAMNLAEAKAMCAAAQKHPGCVTQIVPSPFTLDVDSTVIELIGSGSLGEIREVFVEHATSALIDPDAPLTWRQDPQYSGKNMLTMGIYHEVIQRWFPDDVTVLSASAATYTKKRRHWETGEKLLVELPDALHILARIGSDVLLNYHFSGVESGPSRNDIRIIGSEGALYLDVGNSTLYASTNMGGYVAMNIPPERRRGWRVEADFIESIREGTPVRLTSFANGLRYMAFTESVYNNIRGK